MAVDDPQLADKAMPWYRGLSRTQWWILTIASMGWMFDTMDQQFFNLGRGPAMKDVMGLDPVAAGLDQLGTHEQEAYTSAELDRLVTEGVLTAVQRDRALDGMDGEIRQTATRKDVAGAIGEDLLRPKYVEFGEEALGARAEGSETTTQPASRFHYDSFDEARFSELVAANVLSRTAADKQLALYADGSVPRSDLACHLGKEIAEKRIADAGNTSTTIFVLGWAIGGLFFGWIGDALGRAKTMALTILVYALFTGLNGLAQDMLTFNVLRFLTALGVGGEFAAGAALVAESMPERSRAAALGTLQALSAVGNMMGAALAYFILPVSWRWLFFVGALPGIVAVFVFLKLEEPRKWVEARKKWLEERAAGITMRRASYLGLLGESRWRNRAIVGLLLGVVGVGGLWGIGFFTPELNRMIAAAYSEEAKEKFVSIAFFLQQLGAFCGISAYTVISLRMGRRPAFAIFFLLAFLVVSYNFLFTDTIVEAYILAPLIGFVTLGPFGGFAIYFPELFPTRLRATGTGFCYNVGRILAAAVPNMKGGLQGLFISGALVLPLLPSAVGDAQRAIRYGSFLMLFIYIIGLFVLLFAPETKDQPLPED
ncbi:MAG: MFS transporter [Phycisphaerae bacterium]|nr:MFS transporter [Phycisphaerae bacterium]